MAEAHLSSTSRATFQPEDQPERTARLETAPAGDWYACHTRSRAEKRVHALLGECGIESYLPTVPRLHRWHDRNRTVVLPLFSGYVFARGDAVGRIVETPGVYDVIRFDGRPALVPDHEIRNIRRFVQALAATRHEPPPVAFHEGERVRITSGPFQGVEGVVVQARNRRRVIVGLAAIGAGFALDLPARSVRVIR